METLLRWEPYRRKGLLRVASIDTARYFLSNLIYGIITLNNTGHSGNTIYRTDNGNSSCDKYFTEMRYNLTDEVDLIMCLVKRNSNE